MAPKIITDRTTNPPCPRFTWFARYEGWAYSPTGFGETPEDAIRALKNKYTPYNPNQE